MQLGYAEVIEILRIVDSCGIGELRLEVGELRLHVVKGGIAEATGHFTGFAADAAQGKAGAEPMLSQTRETAATQQGFGTAPVNAKTDAALIPVTAPMVGTFYRAPAPDAAPFVDVGHCVQPDTPVGIVEVMKLMNTVNAGVAGTVREIRAADAQLVEYGQVLILIEADEIAHA